MSLTGISIILLIANGFNEAEFTDVQRALLKTGAKVSVVSPEKSVANGWHGAGWGHYFPVDQHIGDALGSDFDMMVLIGGERGVAKLSGNPHTKRLVGHFFDAQKPLVALNEAVSLLAQPGKLEGKTISADQSDAALAATGAEIAPDAISIDGPLLTARSNDIAEMVDAMLEHFVTESQQLAAA